VSADLSTTGTDEEKEALLNAASRRSSSDVSAAGQSVASVASAGSTGIKFTLKQKAILMGALFMKGGLGGAYAPFFTLWLHVHNYSASEVGIIALIDIVFSILLMPLIGMYLDKWHYHNKGLCLIMASVAILKLMYVPFAQNILVIFMLSAMTAPSIKAANSVLDGQCIYALENRGDFGKVRLFGSMGYGILAY